MTEVAEMNPLASMSSRLLATLLDALVLFIPMAIGTRVIPFIGGVIVFFFYAPMMECSALQATLGKYWLGIKVVDIHGQRITLTAALVRNLLKFLSPVLLFIGCLVAFFNQKKQTLHDLLANTLVIDGRDEVNFLDAWSESVRNTVGKSIHNLKHVDALGDLERLQSLRERGAITEEEFQNQKKKILERS